jgi:hypothetical protein
MPNFANDEIGRLAHATRADWHQDLLLPEFVGG